MVRKPAPEGRRPEKPESAFPRSMPLDYGLDPARTHTKAELQAIIRRVVKAKNVDVAAFFDALSPHEMSIIRFMPEFREILFALKCKAADGTDRITKGQLRALELLSKDEKDPPKAPKEEGEGPLTVEPMGDEPGVQAQA